jgi:DNA-binding NtrC family response regulator
LGTEIEGRSAAFIASAQALLRLATTNDPVLLHGETGTGKDVLATWLHDIGQRAGELVTVNCAAIPSSLFESTMFGHMKGSFTGASEDRAGVFERAGKGDVFLDEIGELTSEQQAKLLRVLQHGDFTPVGAVHARQSQARIIAATNAVLSPPRFRTDLLARFELGRVEIPPLRSRRPDLPAILNRFLSEQGGPPLATYGADAIERLLLWSWPLNMRGARAACRRLADLGPTPAPAAVKEVLEGVLTQSAPPVAADAASVRKRTFQDVTRDLSEERLRSLLAEHAGNIADVARAIGCHRKQLYRLIERYDLDVAAFRLPPA